MAQFKVHKSVATLPGVLEANAIYAVRVGSGFDLYVTNSSGIPFAINPPSTTSHSVAVTLSFGSSFTDKATTLVTGQTWVTTGSNIVGQVLTPSGVDPDEIRLLDFKPIISDLVAGVGFTVTLISEPEARGDYVVMCVAL